MQKRFLIKTAVVKCDIGEVSRLFQEYAASLPIDLEYQDFDNELSNLPGKYSHPGGALFLAAGLDGSSLGCVGLRPSTENGCCEMKRLYIAPSARGLGIGRALTLALIDYAKRQGYISLRLDTLPTMTAATALYEQIGFRPIEPYYGPTPSGTIFMALGL